MDSNSCSVRRNSSLTRAENTLTVPISTRFLSASRLIYRSSLSLTSSDAISIVYSPLRTSGVTFCLRVNRMDSMSTPEQCFAGQMARFHRPITTSGCVTTTTQVILRDWVWWTTKGGLVLCQSTSRTAFSPAGHTSQSSWLRAMLLTEESRAAVCAAAITPSPIRGNKLELGTCSILLVTGYLVRTSHVLSAMGPANLMWQAKMPAGYHPSFLLCLKTTRDFAEPQDPVISAASCPLSSHSCRFIAEDKARRAMFSWSTGSGKGGTKSGPSRTTVLTVSYFYVYRCLLRLLLKLVRSQ